MGERFILKALQMSHNGMSCATGGAASSLHDPRDARCSYFHLPLDAFCASIACRRRRRDEQMLLSHQTGSAWEP
jgi:hypothetical protein